MVLRIILFTLIFGVLNISKSQVNKKLIGTYSFVEFRMDKQKLILEDTSTHFVFFKKLLGMDYMDLSSADSVQITAQANSIISEMRNMKIRIVDDSTLLFPQQKNSEKGSSEPEKIKYTYYKDSAFLLLSSSSSYRLPPKILVTKNGLWIKDAVKKEEGILKKEN